MLFLAHALQRRDTPIQLKEHDMGYHSGPGNRFWKKIENTQEIAKGLASRLGSPERLNRISGAGIHEIC